MLQVALDCIKLDTSLSFPDNFFGKAVHHMTELRAVIIPILPPLETMVNLIPADTDPVHSYLWYITSTRVK